VVFFGRFVAVLRAWAAFLAGVNRMEWPRFLVYNAAGGILWAMIYGIAGYALGDNVQRLSSIVGKVTIGVAALLLVAGFVWLWRNERSLEATAERELPGPLEGYVGGRHTGAPTPTTRSPAERKPSTTMRP
jgi:membrane protein DedA with SNARE-associated domain